MTRAMLAALEAQTGRPASDVEAVPRDCAPRARHEMIEKTATRVLDAGADDPAVGPAGAC